MAEQPNLVFDVSHNRNILESFGVEPAPEDSDLHRQSMWPALAGERWPRRIFGEYHATGSRVAGYMLRDGADKLICHASFPPQLFDLAVDPDETNELAVAEPARIAPLEALSARSSIPRRPMPWPRRISRPWRRKSAATTRSASAARSRSRRRRKTDLRMVEVR